MARNRAETEQKLVEAGIEVFSRRGFDGASVREVADASGVNVSLINRYFESKEGLLLAILERFIGDKQRGELGYPPQATLADELRAYLRFRLDEDLEHAALIRIIISRVAIDEKLRARAMASMTRGIDENLRGRLEHLASTGEIGRGIDLEALFSAVSWLSFSANFFGGILSGRPPAELHRVFDQFASAYAAGIRSFAPDS